MVVEVLDGTFTGAGGQPGNSCQQFNLRYYPVAVVSPFGVVKPHTAKRYNAAATPVGEAEAARCRRRYP
jgi:hypothetical protein